MIFHGFSCHNWSKMKLCPQPYYQVLILLFIFRKILLFSPLMKERKWALKDNASFTGSSKHPCFTLIGWDLGTKFSSIRLQSSVLCSAGNRLTCPCTSWQNHYKQCTALLAPLGPCHIFTHKPPSLQPWWSVELWKFSGHPYHVFFFSHSPPLSVRWSCETTQGKNIPPKISPFYFWICSIFISSNASCRQWNNVASKTTGEAKSLLRHTALAPFLVR